MGLVRGDQSRSTLSWKVFYLLAFILAYHYMMVPIVRDSSHALQAMPTHSDPIQYYAENLDASIHAESNHHRQNRALRRGDDDRTLEEFFNNYKNGPLVDKWTTYFRAYNKHFGPFRDKNITFVEVGVQSGGSILMWKHFFGPGMKYVGIDINPQTQEFHAPEYDIEIVIGDTEQPDFWKSFKKSHPSVDVFLDDGGHKMKMQIVTFEEMFEHVVEDGGVYACEDIHTSYIKDWYMGNPTPSKPFPKEEQTFVEYAKNFIDWLHGQHWNDDKLKNPKVSRSLVGIHFYQNMVFLDKGESGTHDIKAGDYTLDIWSESYDGKKFEWGELIRKWMKRVVTNEGDTQASTVQ